MQTILIATDFSEPAQNAADYAIALAGFLAARTILVHVYKDPFSGPGISDPAKNSALLKSELSSRLAEEKDRLIKTAAIQPDLTALVAEGDPAEVIGSLCSREGVDLVVAGMEGASGILKKYILGSTALTLSEKLVVPTLLVPFSCRFNKIRSITFACDLDFEEGSSVLLSAKALAANFDASLEILNVRVGLGEREYVSEELQVYIDEKLDGIEHSTMLIHNDNPVHSLIKYLNAASTDLVLLHPKKHNLFKRLLRSGVTEKLVYEVKLPMLLIR